MPYRITKKCNQCERCAEVCAQGAIDRNKNYKFFIHKNECDDCGECVKVCPVGAIVWEKRE